LGLSGGQLPIISAALYPQKRRSVRTHTKNKLLLKSRQRPPAHFGPAGVGVFFLARQNFPNIHTPSHDFQTENWLNVVVLERLPSPRFMQRQGETDG
jgi:hypothetical protein